MKIEIWAVEITKERYLQEGEAGYLKRLHHYIPTEVRQFKGIKSKANLSEDQIRHKEYELLQPHLDAEQALLVLLDTGGQQRTSEGFAKALESWMVSGRKKLIFLIGGAYGFAPELIARADARVSLSKMTFTHQMVRLIFLEQLYRAMTILRNEKYHH